MAIMAMAGINGFLVLFAAVLVVTPVVQVSGYCWEPGKNPTFTGAPVVEQIDIRTVRVSWFGLVNNRQCADQFLVKYWQSCCPQDFKTSELVTNDASMVEMMITPKVDYTYQAVAREDKGIIGGIDWNKSPQTDFKTSAYNTEVKPSVPDGKISPASSASPDVLVQEPDMFSIEIIAIIVVCSVVFLLIVVGAIYKLACTKKAEDFDDDDDDGDGDGDDDDDDDDEAPEKEKLQV
jgi:hypothetical protein